MHINKFFLLSVTSFILSFTLSAQVNHVDANKFKNLSDKGTGIVLDVRTPDEYSRGHIENSTLISINDPNVLDKLALLQKNKPIYVYCLTGSRSRAVADYLVKNGYGQVYNLQRGILQWQQMGYTVTRGTNPVAGKFKTYTVGDFNQMLKSNNVVLVDFNAPWCAPCKKMSPIIAEIKQNYSGKAHIEKLDVQSNKMLQKVYGVESIPGLILFKNGKEVWKHTGVISYEELTSIMDAYL